MKHGMLSDLVVLELASVLAGPSVGMFFAEWGARVIKVENFKLGGDVTRTWKLRSEAPSSDRSAYFSAVNWGKDSIGVDLGHPEGRAVVYDLVRKSDIVLLSYKPGDAEKLGMDAATLRSHNPRLIYAALSAYGADDPRPGFDAIIQAESGFTYMNGTPDSGPVKMPVALMDLLAAHQLKEAVLLALLHRERSGEGSVISASLIGSGLASLANQATNYLVGGLVPQRIGSEHPNIVPYGTIYPTADGQAVVLAVGSDQQFRRLCAVLSLDALADDPMYAHNPDRVRHRTGLNALLSQRISGFQRDQLLAALHAAGVPAGAVRDMADALAQPHAQALLLAGEGLKGLRTVAFELEGHPPAEMEAPPHLGAQTKAVLSEICAYSEEKYQSLLQSGAVMDDGRAG